MCSGCSGDYTGGFDDSGEFDTGSDGENLAPANQRRAINSWWRRNWEDDRHSQIDTRSAGLQPVRAEGAERGWEVLVSATRIVEIHSSRSIGDETENWRDAERGSGATAAYHSNAESAKYYQSCRSRAEVRLEPPLRRRNAAPAVEKLKTSIRAAWKQSCIGSARFLKCTVVGGQMQAARTEGLQPPIHEIGGQKGEERGSEPCGIRSDKSGVAEVQHALNELDGSASETAANAQAVELASGCDEDETQLAAIRELMTRAAARGVWLTLGEIAESTEFAEASISAQLRHLRKPHNGGYCVEKRNRVVPRSPGASCRARDARRRQVVWEYRVLFPDAGRTGSGDSRF